ncbi:MAG: hypothetical protein ACRDUV_01860 [Pseudonocardiaceae bacterium]
MRSAHRRQRHPQGGASKRQVLLRTSDVTLTADDLATAYKQLLAVERG